MGYLDLESKTTNLKPCAHLDAPHGLAELPDGGAGVEHNLCPVEAKGHPVEGVVAPVADVHRDAPEARLKHGVPRVPLHVVRALVEVPHPRDVVLEST